MLLLDKDISLILLNDPWLSIFFHPACELRLNTSKVEVLTTFKAKVIIPSENNYTCVAKWYLLMASLKL
jgi:hypothetical protein